MIAPEIEVMAEELGDSVILSKMDCTSDNDNKKWAMGGFKALMHQLEVRLHSCTYTSCRAAAGRLVLLKHFIILMHCCDWERCCVLPITCEAALMWADAAPL